jgi:hypothetical protein
MRILRSLLAIAMVAAVPGAAKADLFSPGDFAAVVIDPPPPASNEITVITSTTINVVLAACQADQLPGLSVSDFAGCFTGVNATGKTITSLYMEFPAIFINGVLDQPSCPTVTGALFSPSCGFTDPPADTRYFLAFSGGNIPTFGQGADCFTSFDQCEEDSLFTFAIGGPGITLANLPKSFTAQANTIAPEPSSIWLMTTGAMSVGLFAAFRRRQMLRVPTR